MLSHQFYTTVLLVWTTYGSNLHVWHCCRPTEPAELTLLYSLAHFCMPSVWYSLSSLYSTNCSVLYQYNNLILSTLYLQVIHSSSTLIQQHLKHIISTISKAITVCISVHRQFWVDKSLQDIHSFKISSKFTRLWLYYLRKFIFNADPVKYTRISKYTLKELTHSVLKWPLLVLVNHGHGCLTQRPRDH